jgi:hypothetical protein
VQLGKLTWSAYEDLTAVTVTVVMLREREGDRKCSRRVGESEKSWEK